MKKRRYKMRRKTKAIVGLVLCFVLLGANLTLRNYRFTKDSVLEFMEEYRSTGDLELIMELPRLPLDDREDYRFYLMENNDCFAMMSINFNLLYGWLDGPCLIVEKDDTKPLNIAYNSFSSTEDEEKKQLRIIGLVNDPDISRLEIDVYTGKINGDQTPKTTTLKTDKFIEFDGKRYFYIEYIFERDTSEYFMPPFNASGFDGNDELVYSQEIHLGQSTFM